MSPSAQLAQLEAAQLVRRTDDEDTAYAFKHLLTRDAAYESLLVKQRRELHRHVAHAYEAEYGQNRLDEFAPILARHYAEAGDEEQTLVYATRVGNLACRVYAHAEAIASYTLALTVGKKRATSQQLQHLYAQRGRAHELNASYPRALENYREMQTVAQARGDRQLELEALMLLATAYAVGTGVRDLAQAQTLSSDALALAAELGDRKAEARIYWNLLLVNRFGVEGPEKAIEYGEKSLAIARELNLKEQIALDLKDMGIAYALGRKSFLAYKDLAESLALWRELDNKPMLAEVLAGGATAYLAIGRIEDAAQMGEESLALNESIGNRQGFAVSATMLSYVSREQGKIQRAIELGEQSFRIGNELGYLGPQGGAAIELAETLVVLGAFQRAEEFLQRVMANVNSPIYGLSPRYPNAVLARLQFRLGHHQAAAETLAAFPLGVDTPNRAFGPFEVLTVSSAHVELALAQGQMDRAMTITEDLIGRVKSLGLVLLYPSALHLKAQVLRRQNRADEAYALLNQAREQAEAIGARYRLWPILLTLLDVEKERGDAVKIEAVCQSARMLIEYLSAQMPLDVSDSFLNLPEVKSVLS